MRRATVVRLIRYAGPFVLGLILFLIVAYLLGYDVDPAVMIGYVGGVLGSWTADWQRDRRVRRCVGR